MTPWQNWQAWLGGFLTFGVYANELLRDFHGVHMGRLGNGPPYIMERNFAHYCGAV